MDPNEKPRRVVGVYDRPARADRRRGPWIWIVLVVLAVLAWVLVFGAWPLTDLLPR